MSTQGTSGSGSASASQAPRPPRSSTPSSSLRPPGLKRPRPAAGASPSSSAADTGTPCSSAAGTPSSSEGGAATATPSPGTTATTPPESEGDDVVVIENVDENMDVRGKRKKKLKSDVWLEFEEVVVNGLPKAKCNWCKKLLVGGSRAGTTHLWGHLGCCPDRSVRKGLKQSTLKLGKDENGAVVVEKYVFDQQVARKELALMICIHEYPLSMVDHVGFRKFCTALQPLFKCVSRNTIKKDILAMFEVHRLSLVKSLHRCQSRVAVTTDMWSANHQRKGYMAVTLHFIDDQWKLKSFLLR